ncbi:hypothetical protein EXIGLDRAFT_775319 [Exidia glandulosa HHB12029]|uniref:Uncharacterized protein n=1 Tax=Exidia glandulosa HHB12029 TaxID=1314781 RepID=A0A165DYD6_EXIGL|nr:hypothetical protein EXIGLDRAFT_775319 [Exidia glandulosa HHB12029]
MLVTLFRLPLLVLSLLLGSWLHVAAAPVASGSYLIANPDNSTGVLMTKFLDITGSMTSDETPWSVSLIHEFSPTQGLYLVTSLLGSGISLDITATTPGAAAIITRFLPGVFFITQESPGLNSIQIANTFNALTTQASFTQQHGTFHDIRGLLLVFLKLVCGLYKHDLVTAGERRQQSSPTCIRSSLANMLCIRAVLLSCSVIASVLFHVSAAPVASGNYLILNPDNTTGILMNKYLDISFSHITDGTPVIGNFLNSPNPSTSNQRSPGLSLDVTGPTPGSGAISTTFFPAVFFITQESQSPGQLGLNAIEVANTFNALTTQAPQTQQVQVQPFTPGLGNQRQLWQFIPLAA